MHICGTFYDDYLLHTTFCFYVIDLPCPHSGAGHYIAIISSSSYPAHRVGQGIILHQFLLLSSSFFFFFFFLLSVNIAISPTAYMVWPCNLHIYQLGDCYKSYGSTGVKKVNHVKNMKKAPI